LHCKKAFANLIIAFVTRIATVDQNSPLWQPAIWAMQHTYSNSWSCYKGWEVCLGIR